MIYNGNGYNFSTPYICISKARNSNARGEKVFFGHGGIRRYSNVQVSGPPGQTFSLFVAAVSCVILVEWYEGF